MTVWSCCTAFAANVTNTVFKGNSTRPGGRVSILLPDQGLIITTSDLSTGARSEAERANAVPVALGNGGQLVGLLVEHDIGVRRDSYYLIELGGEQDD